MPSLAQRYRTAEVSHDALIEGAGLHWQLNRVALSESWTSRHPYRRWQVRE